MQILNKSQYDGQVSSTYPKPSALAAALVDQSLITSAEAVQADSIARKLDLRLADVLCRHFGLSQYSINQVVAEIANAQLINPCEQPPQLSLVHRFGAPKCLQTGLMPWRRTGDDTIILTARPDQFSDHLGELAALFGSVRMAIATEDQLIRAVTQYCAGTLTHQAENRVSDDESSRHWNIRWTLIGSLLFISILAGGFATAPTLTFAVLALWAITVLVLQTGLKSLAAFVTWRDRDKSRDKQGTPTRLPVITMMVPLYNERAIAHHLLARLKAVNYPRELLDICLVLEADDFTTRTMLGKTILPTWIRPVTVPKGTLKTKPRAMNYALNFARGSIIGVWDAEDAPAPDQLHKVAHHFANCGPEVACLQGALDYYNAASNWLTRCFSIEYASWFRVILPGMEKLGLVVPLGGTTLFFRRHVLEKLGGWDAHNVTEDADLGVRLVRHGYRTKLINTVTEEEANGRFWPWVKQRSRWLKGYAVTYRVHMRDPVQLWRDLGAWRFFGVQLLFLGTLSQFVLAPVLWTFWLLPFGITHPLSGVLPSALFWALGGLFITSEIVGLVVAIIALGKTNKKWLIKWAVTMQFYFPMAALAAYKAFYELGARPFYWDKTAHGVLLPDGWEDSPTLPPPQPVHPASAA